MTGRCPTCKGTGRKALPRALVDTIDVLDREWRPTAVVRAGLIGATMRGGRVFTTISINAVANRLERLRSLSLVESRSMKNSNSVEWRLVEEKH